MAYTTQYMSAYRSPHESPTGQEGATSQIVTLKLENNKLRKDNNNMKEELTRLREQLSYIRVASQPMRGKRPPPLDLSNIPQYHPYERRPSVGRISAAVGVPIGLGPGSSSLDSIDGSSSEK
jgi:hypothetical protein